MLPITRTSAILVIFDFRFPKAVVLQIIECVSMVCSLGGGQMATLLEGGSTSPIMTEEVGCWKLAAQYIQRELIEADEANLLDEEDMHVFGVRPMMDPLILVCCNSCKKPVKASQYATHAGICKSLGSVVDSTSELDAGAGQKKPPRKERKKLQITYSTQMVSVGEHERVTLAINDTAASNSHLDEQTQKKTSFSIKAKGEFPSESKARSIMTSDNVIGQQTPTELDDHHLQTNAGVSSIPAPLATKIYYSQRNHRLRSSLSRMFYKSSSTQNDLVNVQQLDENKMPSRTTTPSYFRHPKINPQYEKSGRHASHMVENPHQISAATSEVILDESSTCTPLDSSDQFHVNNPLGAETTGGNLASDFLQNPCLFAGN